MIDVCNENESPTLIQNHALGTEVTVLLVSLVAETIILGYVMYKLLCTCDCKRDNVNKTKLQPIFCILVLIYHISAVVLLATNASSPILIMFGLSNDRDYDLSSGLSCFLITQAPYVPVTITYLALILFWFLRLKFVFKDSIYTISKRFNTIFTTWITSSVLISISVILIMFYVTLMDINNNDKSDIFCKYPIKVVDFIPYLYSDKNYSYSYKLNNFHLCTIKTSHPFYQYETIVNAMGAITVPLANLVSFYLYVSKMKANVNNANHANNQYQRSRIMHVHFTAIIGVISVVSTSIAIMLRAIAIVFSSIVYVDVVLNGILMLMVLDFGKWMICRCCLRLIAKRIWKIEQHTARLSLHNVSAGDA